MKNLILTGLTIGLASVMSYAQKYDEMKTTWEIEATHPFTETGLSEEKAIVHGSNEKMFTMVSTVDGKVKWSKKFKEIDEQIGKVDLQIPMYESNAVFLFDKKAGKDQMVVVDMETGVKLWSTNKYQGIDDPDEVIYIAELNAYAIVTKTNLTMVKARTGEELWSTVKFSTPVGKYFYDEQENAIVIISMPRNAWQAMFKGFRNQILKINAKNGDVLWEQTFVGIVERKIVTRESVAKIFLRGDKLFLQLNGLQVYEYKTGSPIWAAAYDVTFARELVRPKVYGQVVRFGVYEAIAQPLYDGEYVYILDVKSRKSQYLKKYEVNSGKLIWTSPEIKDARVIPGLYKIDDKIILQIGGAVEVQAISKQTYGNGYVQWTQYFRTIKYQNVKPYEVQAFSTNDGTKSWDSERFRKGITNIFPSGKNIVVSSGKALYSLDYKTGKEAYEIALGDDDIGLAEKIVNPAELGDNVSKDNVIVLGEKGVSSHNIATGAKVWAVKTKKGEFSGIFGENIFFDTEKGDYFSIDANSGKAKFFDSRKNSKSIVSLDGKSIYVFEGKKILKVSAE
ncbi:MAG: PQQ-binding-like beta-propeller repeat protein [Bacteroidetes bacterium]|nr:PQQ-binding-like beta-propeller repeat protein [Bacteroidota bacterium]MBS1923228.1 PQQ-binding-like beta-propeller repeat protein [Bacteroidota bacterium]HRE23568.1 PQQ-binding-like beta-propeller repeat protein [Bacteroidia bacterium]HRF15973.1 PQQ-binding-like beta-propeller repeat protein [Bacteroidia bacterium]